MAVQGPHILLDPIMSKLSVSALSFTPTSASRRSIGLPSTPTAEISKPEQDHPSLRMIHTVPRKLSASFGDALQDQRTPASTPTDGLSPWWKMVVLSACRSPTSADKGAKNGHLRDLANISRTKLFGNDQPVDSSCSSTVGGCRTTGEKPVESPPSLLRRYNRSPLSSPDCKMSVKRRKVGVPSAVSTQLFADMTALSSQLPVNDQVSVRVRNVPAESDRYEREFQVQAQLGCGEFGAVFKCRNLVDGAFYAVKRSHQAVDAHVDEAGLREAHTHGMLDSHPHIVRYYSAWLEERRLFMQFEYCSGGSLLDEMLRHSDGLSDCEVRDILVQIGDGLEHIHANQLAHLDIKPGNIFLCRQRTSMNRSPDSETLNTSPNCQCGKTSPVQKSRESCARWIYKIGDFGHSVRLNVPNVSLDVDEGDCRYLSREVLEGNFTDLRKADIFALALTAYEAISATPLPKNGEAWHEIRKGQLAPVALASDELHQLLVQMISPDLHDRPSATELTSCPVLSPVASPSYHELREQLDKEKLKNEKLEKRLAEMEKEGLPSAGWNMTLRPLEGKSRLRTVPNRRPANSAARQMYGRNQSTC